MEKEEAINQAKINRPSAAIPMTVFFDPIGCGEQEGFETAWSYCPTAALEICAKFRQKDLDIAV